MRLVFLGARMEIKAVKVSSAPLFPKTLATCHESAGFTLAASQKVSANTKVKSNPLASTSSIAGCTRPVGDEHV